MPNNFKLQGDYYVSKFGNDSWDGLTPNTPKRTLQAALSTIPAATATLIVGAGVYRETISRLTSAVNAVLTIRADGYVVFEGNGSNSFTIKVIGNISGQGLNVSGVEFRNYANVLLGGEANGPTMTTNLSNCLIKNNVRIGSTGGTINTNFTNCIFLNSTITQAALGTCNLTINSCVLINSICYGDAITYGPTQFRNNYMDSTSYISPSSAISVANLNYNNIQGRIIMNAATAVTTGLYQDTYGRYYDLSVSGNNTSATAGILGNPYYRADTLSKSFSYTNHRILYPTYNVNSISEDPKFNNIESQDFTLQSGSPHIGRALEGINNIGGTSYAIRATATGSFSGSGATVDSDLIFSYDNYVISGSAVTGSVTSSPIFISSSAKVIQDIEYNGLLAFNKTANTSSLFYSGSNVNVPDFDTYTSASGNPGANPDRLVYYMRLTTGSTQPVVDADWDNGNLWTRGDYNVFEWGTKPSIDIYGRGNGDPNFLVMNSSFLRATYIQMKVKLRNDYLE